MISAGFAPRFISTGRGLAARSGGHARECLHEKLDRFWRPPNNRIDGDRQAEKHKQIVEETHALPRDPCSHQIAYEKPDKKERDSCEIAEQYRREEIEEHIGKIVPPGAAPKVDRSEIANCNNKPDEPEAMQNGAWPNQRLSTPA
jgi:hypothetical protein